MSTTPNVPYRLEFSVEVPGTPEQVWQAIATAKGMSAWFTPTEMEEREGGSLHSPTPCSSSSRAWIPAARTAQPDVFREVNPSGCRVCPFGVPTEEELAHDFLWRIHQKPGPRADRRLQPFPVRGCAVVRVHDLAPKGGLVEALRPDQCLREAADRYQTIVLKFFLHISKEEQEERLLERERDPDQILEALGR